MKAGLERPRRAGRGAWPRATARGRHERECGRAAPQVHRLRHMDPARVSTPQPYPQHRRGARGRSAAGRRVNRLSVDDGRRSAGCCDPRRAPCRRSSLIAITEAPRRPRHSLHLEGGAAIGAAHQWGHRGLHPPRSPRAPRRRAHDVTRPGPPVAAQRASAVPSGSWGSSASPTRPRMSAPSFPRSPPSRLWIIPRLVGGVRASARSAPWAGPAALR